MSDFLTKADILAIHQEQIERFGGAYGIRDEGALEAAIFRPQSGYYNDLIEEAAALWESLSQNHPFIDGNKRTAFDATHTFLAINGAEIDASPEQIITFVMDLYEHHRFRNTELIPWLRTHVVTTQK